MIRCCHLSCSANCVSVAFPVIYFSLYSGYALPVIYYEYILSVHFSLNQACLYSPVHVTKMALRKARSFLISGTLQTFHIQGCSAVLPPFSSLSLSLVFSASPFPFLSSFLSTLVVILFRKYYLYILYMI